MRRIKFWVLATFILTFLVIIAGSVVRTTHSGMGCPDWPRCFGKWIPPTTASELPPDFEKYLSKQDIDHSFNAFHTWIEYFNRLLGVLLGIFAIIQLAVLFFKRKLYPKAYRLAVAFLAIVVLTGLFGALVVKLNLQHYSVSVHLLLAIILTQVQLVLLLTVYNKYRVVSVTKSVRNLFYLVLILILVQSALGTGVRIFIDNMAAAMNYSGREKWLERLPGIFLIHRSFSWLVFTIVLYCVWKFRNDILLRKKMYGLASIIVLSLITGVTLYYAGMPAVAQPIHLLLASLAITQSFYIIMNTHTRLS